MESTRNTSLRLDKISLEDTFSLLEEERSEVAQCLQGFCLGSTLQTAVETLVLEIDEVEESKILSEIATETRRLEELELKVYLAFPPPILVTKVGSKDPGGRITLGMAEDGGELIRCSQGLRDEQVGER